ncbi:MAG: ISL3 family transposase [Desulfobacteraceae bacterium]|nr:ISL3 family transposase [Desulfobacteraceae bacterium]
MHLDTITKLLDIPNYRAVEVTGREYEGMFGIILERVKDTPPVCSGCGRIHGMSVHSEGTITVEDLMISGKRVFLHVPKRKVPCIEDGRIRVEDLQWLNGRFTARFAEQVYRLTSITTNQEAGWFLRLDDETVYRIDKRKLEELALEKLDPVPAPKHMSVDEVAWQKWHKYVTNVIDVDQRKVIWNHQGRGKVNLDKFFRSLGAENCEKIEAVACDGARGYLSSIKQYATNALIVLDHFHVKKYLNDAVDTVRKEELKKARQQNNGELSAILHCNKRFILMQNKVTNKKQDLLEKLATLNERVYQAMLLKEQFVSIYTDPRTARRTLREWIVAAIKSKIPAFVELGSKFFRKRNYLLNYFRCKITTAISEGMNNKIKRLSRMAYGYRNVHYFLLKIHQHCGLLNPRLST